MVPDVSFKPPSNDSQDDEWLRLSLDLMERVKQTKVDLRPTKIAIIRLSSDAFDG